MIYATQLHAGHFYVCATTDAPHRETYAVEALPIKAFDDLANARQAARIAADWADRNRWRIMATDRATGEEFECFVWTRCPSAGIARAMADAREFGRDCYGFKALPAA